MEKLPQLATSCDVSSAWLKQQCIYIRTVSSQRLLSTLLNQIKLVYGPFGQSNMHSKLSRCLHQTSQEENECTITMITYEKLRVFCLNIYTVVETCIVEHHGLLGKTSQISIWHTTYTCSSSASCRDVGNPIPLLICEKSFFQSQKILGKCFKEERILKKISMSVISSGKVNSKPY